MYALLWLLLPVAAASGWFVARQSYRKSPQVQHKNCPQDYFRGLSYLLDEQQDKAIEVFTKMLEEGSESETVETHITLGTLFRRRGEVDRAIRIHQSLIDNQSLTEVQRQQAMLELGYDYFRAGLLDRVESLMVDLVARRADNELALKLLKAVYEQEHEWPKAIDIARRLETVTGKDLRVMLAQYHCEIGQDKLNLRDLEAAAQAIDDAFACDGRCVRASMLRAELFVQKGDFHAAIKAYERVAEQDPAFLSEVIGPLLDCYYKAGMNEAMTAFLRDAAQKYGRYKVALVSADLLRRQHDDQDAAIVVAHHLKEAPSLRGLVHLVDINLNQAQGEMRDTLRVIRNTLETLLESHADYQCSQCGFGGKLLHWQCPSCKSWNSMRPVETAK